MKGIESGTVLLGKYKVVRVLGKGGFSTVYLAENTRVGNLVAIKVVSKETSDMDLMAEKNILKGLRHASIPVIIDIEETDGVIYLIEEYVEGISLSELKLKLTEQQVIDIMHQLIDVLSYLHTSQNEPIIYRDLKPDNIIQMANGHIKLIDFGIAKRFSIHDTKDTMQFGTRGYAAPEQYGMQKTDERTDIFSLGVCMYYLMTGKNLSTPPYKLKSLKLENPEVSVAFDKVISRCIASVPARRYANVSLVKQALEQIGNKEDPIKDYETFAQYSDIRVHCIGTKPGIGTTHMALMVANYYKSKGFKVALVEYHRSETFSTISLMRDDVKEHRHFFTMEGLDCYPFRFYGCFTNTITENYDVLVIDAGSVNETIMTTPENSIEMVVSGLKEWEIGAFEDYYLNKRDITSHYFFNYADDQTFEALKDSIDGIKCYQVPYTPNPFILNDDTVHMLGTILKEEVPAIEAKKGKQVHVKAILDKAINKIQSIG